MKKKRTLSPQEQTQRRTRSTEKRVGLETLIIPYRSRREREAIRSRVWYSGASAGSRGYVATCMRHLGLASFVLMDVRNVSTVRVVSTRGGFKLLTPTKEA